MVLFDLDDTLHDDTGAYHATALRVAAYVAQRFGIDTKELAEAYLAEINRFYEELSAADIRVRNQSMQARWWGRAFVHFGIRDRELAGWCAFAFDQLNSQDLAVVPGVHEMLAKLRQQGVKLGLLTNGFSVTHRKKIADLGLSSSFDEVFLADEVGMVKPDPRIFRHACDRLNTSVERAVMVGDLYERDIVGAHEAGLFTIWVNHGKETIAANLPRPDATVTTIVDTLRVLPPIFAC